MNLRRDVAIAAAKTISFGLKLTGRGATTLPGKTAIKICPDIIKIMSSGKKIITVTGTNGKTTTSHMISEMLQSLGYHVINNISGANLASGIATTLINSKESSKDNTVYVLETDEAAFAKTAGDINPTVIVVTNLFRDQLDRYGELTHTRDLIAGGTDKAANATLILNSDDSLVASLGKGRETRSLFFGSDKESMKYNNENYPEKRAVLAASSDAVYCPECQKKYEYKARSFGHLGDFSCPGCGFKSPENRFRAKYDLGESPADDGYKFVLADGEEEVSTVLQIPGMHNIYNTCAAVAAVTVFEEKTGKETDAFKRAINASENVKAAFGRMEKIEIGDKKLCILLVKNPVGLDRSLSFVAKAKDAGALMLLLNSNTADGKDVSWIWDVDFESRCDELPDRIYVSGRRWADMLLRVVYSGRDKDNSEKPIKYGDMSNAISLLEEALEQTKPGDCVYVLPNYTSMLALRGQLVKKYGLKDFWK